MRALVTGMSGVGKSTLVGELCKRGYTAFDAEDHGFAEPRAEGRWGWRFDKVSELLDRSQDQLTFFARCSEEQAELPFHCRVLLTAPKSVLIDRLRIRTSNPYRTSASFLKCRLTSP